MFEKYLQQPYFLFLLLFAESDFGKNTMPYANKNKAKFIKSTGDGFLITFGTPKQALNTAISLLRQIRKHKKKKKEKNKLISVSP